MVVRCAGPSGALDAGLFFGAFPEGVAVQAAVRTAAGTVERFGPLARLGPAHGFHDPQIVERADVLRLLGVAFSEGAKQRSRMIGVRNSEPTPALEIAWRAVGQLKERASVFPVHSSLALALSHSPGIHTLEILEAAFAELVRDRHLIPEIRRGVGEARTTARAVRSEREDIERMTAGVGATSRSPRAASRNRHTRVLPRYSARRRGSSSKAVTARLACRALPGSTRR